MQKPSLLIAITLAGLTPACTSLESITGSFEQQASTAISTDASSYTAADPIVVQYDGLAGDVSDWVGIAPVGSEDYMYVDWQHTDGSASGLVTFGPGLPPGTYVARAYPLGGIERSGESPPFTVADVSLTTDKANYASIEPIVVTYAGFSADDTDWVTIVPQGSPTSSFGEWHYTSGQPSGELVFGALSAGNYEVRAYFHGNVQLIKSTNVVVENRIALAADRNLYPAGDAVVVSYDRLPGNAEDWIGIYPEGADDFGYVAWTYTGAVSGTATFENLPNGNYVARAFENGSLRRLTESAPFSVGAMQVVAASNGLPFSAITVSYSGFTLDATDWVTIVPANAPDASFNEWFYTSGEASGELHFHGLAAGSYEVRGYLAGGVQLVARTHFDIAADAATVATSQNVYSMADSITVLFDRAPGNAADWIGISPVGADAETYVAWTYTEGEITGSRTFAALPAGQYEARLYLDGTATILATATFTVSAGAVSTNQASYQVGDVVTVDYSGLSGDASDWIGISVPGSAMDEYVAWVYAAGAQGSAQFADLPAGTYEARAFLKGTTQRIASSTTFTVEAAP